MMKRAVVLAAMLAASPAAFAHGDSAHVKKAPRKAAQPAEEKAFGRAGDPAKVTRTVRIEGTDNMRYTPAAITVRRGQTIRFVVKNAGKMMHETVIGTMAELQAHYEVMKKFPDMEHDEPYMVHLKPGETGEMFWQFTKAGEFFFACLIPGHLEAGMLGKITVR
ncbi:MAG: cupredoxin family protein [Burkholderiales bacterium]